MFIQMSKSVASTVVVVMTIAAASSRIRVTV